MLGMKPTYRPMLAVDIERSAGRGDLAQSECRQTLFSALQKTFAESGIDWDSCHRDDLGDGMRVIVGPDVPKARLIHPVVRSLADQLHAHNRLAGPLTRVRVRVAVHAGDVHVGDGRVMGSSLEVLARHLDAGPVKQALAAAPASVTVALVVSRHIYEEVVRHGYPGIDPATYRPITFTEKEMTTTAWLHLPGASQVPDGHGVDSGAIPDMSPSVLGDRVVERLASRAESVNIAMGHAQVGQQVGRIGTRISHVTGNVSLRPDSAPQTGLHDQLAELRQMLDECRRDNRLDADTFTAAKAELDEASRQASTTDGRRGFLLAMKRLRGLVADVADLAAKVAAVIAAADGLR